MSYKSLKGILKERDQLTADDISWVIDYIESKHSRFDIGYRYDVISKLRHLIDGSES